MHRNETEHKIAVKTEAGKSAKQSVVELEHRIKDLAEIIKYAEQYKANRSYQIGYKKAKNLDAYFRKYESQIILYGGARRMLEQAGINLKGLNVDKLKAEFHELTKQKNGLTSTYKNSESSKGRYGKDTAVMFRKTAKSSIGSHMPAKSLELKHTIRLSHEPDAEIKEIENEIKIIMDEINSPILTIPGISYHMGAMFIAEISDFAVLIHQIRYWRMLLCHLLSHATKKLVRIPLCLPWRVHRHSWLCLRPSILKAPAHPHIVLFMFHNSPNHYMTG